MKKFYLFLMTMMVSVLSAFAQEPAAPKFSPLATDGATVQYLYNVETHTFMLGANDWKTRASVSVEKGYQFKIADNGNGTYTLNDYVETKSAWMAVFADSPTGIWVDNLGGANVKGWVITSVGENLYKITNPGAGAGELSVVQDLSDTRLNLNASNPAAYAATWALVSEADYAEYMSTLDAAAVNAYAASKKEQVAKALQSVIDEANYAALAARTALANGTNVYGEGYEAWVAKTAELAALVEAGNYTEKIVNPNAATGWHASTEYNFLLTPWTTGGQAANNFDKNLYINTWSVEGNNDGTEFYVPFFEYWTGDDNSLGANELATTVTGLTPGAEYTTTVWARVRIKNNGGTDAYGITFVAGGEPVDVCAGEGPAQFRLIHATATGVADEEGNLKIAFNIAEDNNVSWLSYKDVYYAPAAGIELETVLMLGEEQNTINTKTAVSLDGADAIKVNVINAPEAVGITYLINEMVQHDDEEGTYWTVGAELASGEANLNGIAYATLDSALVFAQGTKYQVSVSVLGQELNEIAIEKYEINGSYVEPMEIETVLMLGEEQNTINSHSAVSLDAADAIKVNVINAPEAVGITYLINEMVQHDDEEGTYWTVGAELASGEANLNGIAYAQLDSALVFAQGTKYQVAVSVLDQDLNEIAIEKYEINGSYVEPLELETVLINGEEEIALNTHSNVSVEAASALKVNFINGAEIIGATYSIKEMKMGVDDEGIFWHPASEIVAGELSMNAIGYAEFETPLTFEQGKKYQLTVTPFVNAEDPTELASVVYEFNGATEAPVISLLENGDFAEGVIADGINIATYAKDGTPNQMQAVPGWELGVENGDARAAGVMAYGSTTSIGGTAYVAPAEGPKGTNGNALGMVGVWTGTVQYVQNVTLPAGTYKLNASVYNTAGTSAFVKNLIGVKYGETENYASTKLYAVGVWSDEEVVFTVEDTTTVTVSVGYEGANVGSSASQHLFFDNIILCEIDPLIGAKTAAIAALPVADESMFTPSVEDVNRIKLNIQVAETVEDVEAAAAEVAGLDIPALHGEYNVINTNNDMYINGAVIAEEPASISFEKAENGFYIKVGEEYLNMAGGNTWSINTAAEAKTAWNFILADGAYTIKGPNGSIGVDYGIKAENNVDVNLYGNKSGKGTAWVIEEVLVPVVLPELISGEDFIALNSHSAVSVESAEGIKVSYENVTPMASFYSISSMIEVAGEESSSWEVNEEIVAKTPIMGHGVFQSDFAEPIVFEQGTKYQVAITYVTMTPGQIDPETGMGTMGKPVETTVYFNIDGAYAAPAIAEVAFINDTIQTVLNSKVAVSVESAEAVKVTFGNPVDVKSASYAIYEYVANETEEGTEWVPAYASAKTGDLSVNVYGYAELNETFYQGTKYGIDINVVYLDESTDAATFDFNGATEKDEPQAGEVTVVYGMSPMNTPQISCVFENENDVAPSSNGSAILLDGVDVEKDAMGDWDQWNKVWINGHELADGEHTLVFTVGSLMINGNENEVEYTVTFTVGGAPATPQIAVKSITLDTVYTTPDEDGDIKLVINNVLEANEAAQAAHVEAIVTVFNAEGDTISWAPYDLHLDNSPRNVYVSKLEPGKTYKIAITAIEGGVLDWTTWDDTPVEFDIQCELPALDVTVTAPAPELAEIKGDNKLEDMVVYIKKAGTDEYLYGPNAQNTGLAAFDQLASGAVQCYKIEATEKGFMFRCVTPAGGDYSLWGANPCYLNSQPAVGGVSFNLGKNQDIAEGSTWQLIWNEATASWTIQNVANGGYLAGTTISAEVESTWVLCTYDELAPATGINSIATASKANGKYIENGKIVIVKNGVKYNVAGSIIK